jgi:hypothetical protein
MAKQSKKNRKGPKPAKVPNRTITVERPKITSLASPASPETAVVKEAGETPVDTNTGEHKKAKKSRLIPKLKRKYASIVGEEEADELFNKYESGNDREDSPHPR